MPGEINLALTAINQPLNSKESKYRELSTLMQFDQKLEGEEQKEMAAQVAYTQYEESVNKVSESLLEGDRKQIKRKSRDLQSDLKEEISKAGSYKKFMEKGGIRLLSNYKEQVLNSNEANIYKDNAKYMAHIIKARDAGKGGLISSKDLKALKDYEANGYGKLSYGGLLSEIEMPDLMAYEFGKDIPAADILENKNNYSAILGNYMREKPEKGEPTHEELVKYTNEKYGGKGKNAQVMAMRQRASTSAAQKAAKAEKSALQLTTLGNSTINSLNGAINGGKQVGFDVTEDYDKIYKRAGQSGVVTDEAFDQFSETDNEGFWNLKLDTPAMRLKGARINGAYDSLWAKARDGYIDPSKKNEDGTYTFNPSSSRMYGADGEVSEITENRRLVPVNIVHASMVTDEKGVSKYVSENTDRSGNIGKSEQKENEEYLAEFEGTKAYMKDTEVWRDADSGYLYYRELPMADNIGLRSAFQTAIKEENDLSGIVESETQFTKNKNIIAASKEVQRAETRKQVNATYGSEEFSNSLHNDIISEFNFPANEDIFGTMAMAFTMANKTYTGGKNEDGSYANMSRGASANEVIEANKVLATLFTAEAIGELRGEDLTMDKAYKTMSSQLDSLTDDGDKEAMGLMLEYWKPLYESKTGQKFKPNLEKE